MRGPKFPLFFVGAIFAIALLLLWAFPETAGRVSTCNTCGATHLCQVIVGSEKRYLESFSEPRVEVGEDHVHEFSEPTQGESHRTGRWNLSAPRRTESP